MNMTALIELLNTPLWLTDSTKQLYHIYEIKLFLTHNFKIETFNLFLINIQTYIITIYFFTYIIYNKYYIKMKHKLLKNKFKFSYILRFIFIHKSLDVNVFIKHYLKQYNNNLLYILSYNFMVNYPFNKNYCIIKSNALTTTLLLSTTKPFGTIFFEISLIHLWNLICKSFSYNLKHTKRNIFTHTNTILNSHLQMWKRLRIGSYLPIIQQRVLYYLYSKFYVFIL